MRGVLLACALAAAGSAQTTFEAASIKAVPLDKSALEGQRGPTFSPGSMVMRAATLRALIMTAYDVKPHQISGPPSLDGEGYDVVARTSGPATAQEMRPMLQALLAERFQLALHRETKAMPVYALVVGKNGTRLKESTAPGSPRTRPEGESMVFEHFSIAQLTGFLTRMRSLNRPVIDETGMPGEYDFRVDLLDSKPEDGAELKRATERAVGDPAFATRLTSQLGLKLDPRTAPTEVLVIDRAEKPAAN